LSADVITIRSADGLSLVAEYHRPEKPLACALICHAHPRMQGTMKSPLLLALGDELYRRSYSVLRFNFRGVDGSDGEMGVGLEEVDDVFGALQFLGAEERGKPIALVGWSFGGAVALRAVAHGSVAIAACAAIAPPVAGKPNVTAALPSPHEMPRGVPLLIVCGSNDKVISVEECRTWAEAAGATYEEIPAANHFFWAKYEVLVETVVRWLDKEVVGSISRR
jgi:uncharacterized protein